MISFQFCFVSLVSFSRGRECDGAARIDQAGQEEEESRNREDEYRQVCDPQHGKPPGLAARAKMEGGEAREQEAGAEGAADERTYHSRRTAEEGEGQAAEKNEDGVAVHPERRGNVLPRPKRLAG